MKLFYTRHQVPRGAMPDAEKFNVMYLIKNVPQLRATYQIRLLAFKAVQDQTQLVISVPKGCIFHDDLEDLIRTCKNRVRREDR